MKEIITEASWSGLEIAIIGMACRIPGATDWRTFWDNLVHERESIHFLSAEELALMGIDEKITGMKNYVNATVVLKEKDQFDAAFFDYRPVEAAYLNPVHRVFHTCVWEALEDAGCDPSTAKGPIGVFAGGGDDTNWRLYSGVKNVKQDIDGFSQEIISNKDFLASLLSYKLDLKGPVMAVNTTCSTSLVAINQAIKGLLFGEANIAVAGGVSLKTREQRGYFYEEGLILSADGHCRAFDKDASGTVAGEGAGVIVLKRLKDAIQDGDHIYAVIRGTAINNDGNRKVGYTAPSVEGQVECIRRAQKFARVEPESITYVEAHGTGTRLGDPVEIEALNIAFNRNNAHRCAIGSVKTNIGHLDTAAGVIGVIKTALCLKYGKIPASLHYKTPNPEIGFDAGPFYVNDRLNDWKRNNGKPLRAGVSSFGIGGTNAHAILEEAPQSPEVVAGRACQLVTLSAKTEGALLRYIDKLKNFLQQSPGIHLADLAYTFQTGRKQFSCRVSIPCNDLQQLISLLDAQTLKKQMRKVSEQKKTVLFLFPGQGSQYPHMCKDLYLKEPFFRQEMDKGFAIIEKLTGENMREILFPQDGSQQKIHETRYTQPILFLVEYALTTYLRSIGVAPRLMMGHSIGEYVAACIAGVLELEDAIRIVVRRGELMFRLPAGVMVSVAISAAEAAAYLNEEVSLAAVNAPEQVVLSGTPEAMQQLMHSLDSSGLPYTQLKTSHAFHSAMLDPILDEFRQLLETITFHTPTIPFISNLTGELIREAEARSPEYWVKHMRHTVRFSEGINTLLLQSQELMVVEVGAGHTLTGLLQLHKLPNNTPPAINLVRSVKENRDDLEYLTGSIGQLWNNGAAVDWAHYTGKRKKLSLPTYSFEPVQFPAVVNPFEPALMENWGLQAKAKPQDLQHALYYPVWKQSILEAGKTVGKRKFLLFSFSKNFSGPLKERLKTDGHDVIEVFTGDGYAKISNYEYTIAPNAPGHFDELLEDISKDEIQLTDILYTWGMGADAAGLELAENNPALDLSYFGMVRILQALLNRDSLEGKRIAVITSLLHQVLGTETPDHTQSLLLGLVQVVSQEHAVTCYNIDIDMKENRQQYLPKLLQEIYYNEGKQDRLIALRNGHRWLQDHQQHNSPLDTELRVPRKGGTYLITGGLGNVGFVLAKYLITEYGAKLIITGRRQASLANDNTRLHPELWMNRLSILHGLSSDLRYYNMDVSKLEELEEVVHHAESVFGQIHGVIHAAGIVDDRWFQFIGDISTDKALQMLAPKVEGIENLYKVFRHRSPDFVWATSSLSTVLGGLGFATYAAANQYMDHFITNISREFPAWRAVGLGEMVFNEKASPQAGEALTPAEIIAVFEWSLSVNDCPVIIETKRSLEGRKQKLYDIRHMKADQFTNGQQPAVKAEKQELSASYVAPATAVETSLCTLYESFFGTGPIGVEDNFYELGGDSLKAMVLVKRIKTEFSINLPLKAFLHHANIRQLSVKVEELQWLSSNMPMENEITI